MFNLPLSRVWTMFLVLLPLLNIHHSTGMMRDDHVSLATSVSSSKEKRVVSSEGGHCKKESNYIDILL